MIGRRGKRSRMALETATAGATCGPPITLTPTASKCSCSSTRSVSPTTSRSRLPSMIRLLPVSSSAADRFNSDSGNRALWREVTGGLISRVLGERVMAAKKCARSAWTPQLEHQRDGYFKRAPVEVRVGGDVGRVEHRFQHPHDFQAHRRAGRVPVAVEMRGIPDGAVPAVRFEVTQPAEHMADRVHVAAQDGAAGPRRATQFRQRGLQAIQMSDRETADRQVRERVGYWQALHVALDQFNLATTAAGIQFPARALQHLDGKIDARYRP